ncbi:uncharacterized protein [Montipora foliosa]|uniref:uncharacterized protein n=1 Tax=Montipora foliosa TaxID=591990 RepID=UPI0035F14795
MKAKVKSIFAILLFVCVANASRYSFTLPKENLKKLHEVAKDVEHASKLTNLGSKNIFSGMTKRKNVISGGKDGSESKKNDTSEVVQLMIELIPVLEELNRKRHELGKQFASDFAAALVSQPDDTEVIKIFGSHVRQLHMDCNQHMIDFAKDVKEAGLFEQVKRDDLNFAVIMDGVIASAEEGGQFLQEYFAAIDKHYLHNDPVIKIINTIGTLYADAACDLELGGYLAEIEKQVNKSELERRDNEEGFCPKRSFQEVAMGVSCSCRAAKDALSQFHGVSPEYRCWHLMFKDGCGSLEVGFVASFALLGRKIVEVYTEGYQLMAEVHKHSSAAIQQMVSFYQQGDFDAGDVLLAKFVLGGLRSAFLVQEAIFNCPECPEQSGEESGEQGAQIGGEASGEEGGKKGEGQGGEQGGEGGGQKNGGQKSQGYGTQNGRLHGQGSNLHRLFKPRRFDRID